MKKYLAFLLAALLLLSLFTGCGKTVPSADTMADFAAVGAEYVDAVRHVVAQGVMKADENNCFRPQEVMPRAEAENLLYALAGGETTSAAAEESIGGLVLAQMAMEVTGNAGNNLLGSFLSYNANLTDNAVTREQAAQLAHNYLTYASAMAAGMEQTTLSFAKGEGVKLLGRAEVAEDGVVTNFPGDGVEFSLECAGPMSVLFDATYNCNYRISVDGVLTEFRSLALEETVLAGMIPAGKHTIAIVQDSEVNTAGKTNTIKGASAVCKADTLTPAPERELYIEFIGDSITAGQGAAGDKNSTWSFNTHSVTNAYAYMTAQKMDADYAILAKGGIGAYMCSASLWEVAPYLAGQMYAAQNVYRDETVPATHGKADIVVIAIGTNDKEEDPDTQFETKFRELVQMVREGNPTADIVFIFNMMNARHLRFYVDLAEELGGAEQGYYTLMMERLTNGVATSKGATPHPGTEDNDKNSDKLVEFLKTLPAAQKNK